MFSYSQGGRTRETQIIPHPDSQPSLSGLSGSFVANRTQLNTNVSKVTVDSGFIADALIYIQFPSGGFPAAETISPPFSNG